MTTLFTQIARPFFSAPMVLACVLLSVGAFGAPALGGEITFHVDAAAPAGGNGLSWPAAFTHPQAALDAADNLPGQTVLIKVAQGLYVPTQRLTPSDPRSATFQLRNNCTLRGGYAGLSDSNPDAHDPELYETVCSGDINGNDGPDFLNYGENAYHVFVGSGTNSTARLEYVSVIGGNADVEQGIQIATSVGGGVFANTGSPVIRHCEFRFNNALLGGGVYTIGPSSLAIEHCRFIGNKLVAIRHREPNHATISFSQFATNNGAILLGNLNVPFPQGHTSVHACVFTGNFGEIGTGINSRHSLTVEDSSFDSNYADIAYGAIFSAGVNLIDNCQFTNNTAGLVGGALGVPSTSVVSNCAFANNSSDFLGGAVVADGDSTFFNCTFSRNRSANGGGVYVVDNSSFVNCSFRGNVGHGITVDNQELAIAVRNSILWHNAPAQLNITSPKPTPPNFAPPTVTVHYSNIQGGWEGEGNIDADPLFLQPGCDNLRLAHNSPCIDAGNNSYIPSGVTTDLDGQPRIQNGIVDMGAYEGGHNPLPMTACADNIYSGDQINLIPSGSAYNPIQSAAASLVNYNGPDGASATVTQFSQPIHPGAGGFNELRDSLVVQTTIADGDLLMRLVIPFDAATLNGFSPLDVELTFFASGWPSASSDAWMLAVAGNLQNSPGHNGPIGDRIVTQSSINGPSHWGWNWEVGDYGIFWNPVEQRGFAWAVVDHAGDFAIGIPLPQCTGDCTYPADGVVNHTDLVTVVSAWGTPAPGPQSFADITGDGFVNVNDLLAVINHWGRCK